MSATLSVSVFTFPSVHPRTHRSANIGGEAAELRGNSQCARRDWAVKPGVAIAPTSFRVRVVVELI
jgi:hypothetical protein